MFPLLEDENEDNVPDTSPYDALRQWVFSVTEKRGDKRASQAGLETIDALVFPSKRLPTDVKHHKAKCHVPEMHAKKNTSAFSAAGGNFIAGLKRKSLSVERAANLEEKLLTVCHLVVMGKTDRLSHYGDSVTCASLFLA